MTGQGALTPAIGCAAGVQAGWCNGSPAHSLQLSLITFATSGKTLEQGALQSKQAEGAFDLLHDNDVDDIHQH